MSQKSVAMSSPSERLVKNIRRATRKQYSAEEKIRIVLDGLRGESSIAELCRREGIAGSLYYSWSKEWPAASFVDTDIGVLMEPEVGSREFKLEAVKLVRERGVSAVQAARDLVCRLGSDDLAITLPEADEESLIRGHDRLRRSSP